MKIMEMSVTMHNTKFRLYDKVELKYRSHQIYRSHQKKKLLHVCLFIGGREGAERTVTEFYFIDH